MTTPADPRGRILKINHKSSGHTETVIDNGPFRTITIHSRTEALHELLGEDLEAIRAHLMTRMPGHFRYKGKR